MNKKGTTLTLWVEGILLVTLFITLITMSIGGMNVHYSKDYQVGLGTNTTEAFGEFSESSINEIEGGEAEFTTTEGLSLKSSWSILKTTMRIIFSFLTGSFISIAFNYLRFPPEVAIVFRLIFTLSIIFLILRALFKVKV